MKPLALYAGVIPALVVAADQATKWWATRFFEVPMNVCASVPDIRLAHESPLFVDLALYCNQGISFGLLGGDSALKRWALTILALVVCGFLVWTLRSTTDRLSRWGLALIIGGAVGNAIDRALYGAVTDFVDVTDLFPFFNYIFNVADSAITVGVIALIGGALLESRRTADPA